MYEVGADDYWTTYTGTYENNGWTAEYDGISSYMLTRKTHGFSHWDIRVTRRVRFSY